jgi:hypothetical protein
LCANSRFGIALNGRHEDLKEHLVYKEHRIHTKRLFSGRWVGAIVNVGKKKVITKDSLTEAVTRIPGEYDSEDETVEAAKGYIDGEGLWQE